MAFDKSIESGKEHRRQYVGAKRVDKSCRNHGSCPWCQGNRTHSYRKRLSAADFEAAMNLQ